MGDVIKVLMLNGSPRESGNIALAFHEMEKVFEENGVEYENILLGRTDIRGCIACETCRKNGKCVFNDIVNELSGKFEEADGLVIGSPVYY
ncbi:MAG: flavodoxin family protein, partial [Lachnospiraceae bacterium]|nr:flavodoxin family protein [Lachnospiraceae bacterium]